MYVFKNYDFSTLCYDVEHTHNIIGILNNLVLNNHLFKIDINTE